MVSGLPDWWRKFFFVGQDDAVWGAFPWASRAGLYRAVNWYGAIISGSEYVHDIRTIPSGKTFFLCLFMIGAEEPDTHYFIQFKDNAGVTYAEMVVHNYVVIPYNPPIPVPGGRTLELHTYGYSSTNSGYYATVIGFDL